MKRIIGMISGCVMLCGLAWGGITGDIQKATFADIAYKASTNFSAFVDSGATFPSTNIVITGSGVITNAGNTNWSASPNGTYATNSYSGFVNSNAVFYYTDTTNNWSISDFGTNYLVASWRLIQSGVGVTNSWWLGTNSTGQLTSGVYVAHGTLAHGSITANVNISTNHIYTWIQGFSGTTNGTGVMTFMNGVLVN